MRPYAPELTASATILTVPGLMNSGPGHWQTIWEAELPNCHRAELGSWDAPQRNSWIAISTMRSIASMARSFWPPIAWAATP